MTWPRQKQIKRWEKKCLFLTDVWCNYICTKTDRLLRTTLDGSDFLSLLTEQSCFHYDQGQTLPPPTTSLLWPCHKMAAEAADAADETRWEGEKKKGILECHSRVTSSKVCVNDSQTGARDYCRAMGKWKSERRLWIKVKHRVWAGGWGWGEGWKWSRRPLSLLRVMYISDSVRTFLLKYEVSIRR